MRYESAFEVAGTPAEVLDTFADLPTVASFLPGASVGAANEDGSCPGTLVVAFGPKKLAFKGRVENQVDRAALSGVVSGTASADVRGARMAVTMRYQLGPSRERTGGTRVELESDAELTGMLAEFAKTGGVVLANAVLADFAQRLSAHFEARSTPPVATPAMSTPSIASTSSTRSVSPAALTAPSSLPAASSSAALPTSPTLPPRAPAALSATSLAGTLLRALAASALRAVARTWRSLTGSRS